PPDTSRARPEPRRQKADDLAASALLCHASLAQGTLMAEREYIDTDVVIVGAGPAGLAAAIRLKQQSPETSVTVVEKAAEIGGHILSGAVMDPVGLTELIPDWRQRGAPVGPTVTDDRFHVLGRRHDFVLPNWLLPPLMQTRG